LPGNSDIQSSFWWRGWRRHIRRRNLKPDNAVEHAEGGLPTFFAVHESGYGPGCVKKGPYRHPAQNAVGIGVTEPNFFWNPFSERP